MLFKLNWNLRNLFGFQFKISRYKSIKNVVVTKLEEKLG